MAFRRSDLQEAFTVAGAYPFRVWGLATADPLEEVLAPGYFRATGSLQPGELIYVRSQARPGGAVRMALVMARGAERGTPQVRLVQDFGTTDGPASGAATPAAAPDTPPKRRRGRPPGSRNKKPA